MLEFLVDIFGVFGLLKQIRNNILLVSLTIELNLRVGQRVEFWNGRVKKKTITIKNGRGWFLRWDGEE